MFDSTFSVLSRFLPATAKLNRFTLFNVEARRGENPEDIFYYCQTNTGLFVVLETDYIGDLSFVYKEVLNDNQNTKKLSFLAKDPAGDMLQLLTLEDAMSQKENVILSRNDTPEKRYNYLVLYIENGNLGGTEYRYHPTAYGYTDKK